MTNIDTVHEVYEAFGCGDVATIMEVLADDIEWEYGMADGGVPWLRPRTGRAGALDFFHSLSAVEFRKFQPKMLLADGDVVVALIDLVCVVTATGIEIKEENEVHICTSTTRGRLHGSATSSTPTSTGQRMRESTCGKPSTTRSRR